MVKIGLLFGVETFFIAHGGEGLGIPVDHAQASVNVAFGMQVKEGVNDTFAVVVVEGEAGPLPIAAGTQFAELLEDDAAVLAVQSHACSKKASRLRSDFLMP